MFESDIEQITLDILRKENGYDVLYGPDLSEGENKEREYAEVALTTTTTSARINYPPDDPATGEYTISVTKVLQQAELLADYWTSEN